MPVHNPVQNLFLRNSGGFQRVRLSFGYRVKQLAMLLGAWFSWRKAGTAYRVRTSTH